MGKGKLLYLLVFSLLVVAIVALIGCVGGGEDMVSETGTVKYINLEGGFYGIITDDGKQYDPVNLSQEFNEDGLRIRFEAKVRNDMASIHMWGTLIEITRIEKLK